MCRRHLHVIWEAHTVRNELLARRATQAANTALHTSPGQTSASASHQQSCTARATHGFQVQSKLLALVRPACALKHHAKCSIYKQAGTATNTYPCQHARSVHALLRLNTPDFFVAFFFAWLFGAAVDLAPPASVVWLPFSKAARRAFWKSSSASVAVALCSLYILRMRLTPCAHIARYS